MISKYKSKEFALTLYILSIILFCIYKLIEIIAEYYILSKEYDEKIAPMELEWGYLAIFIVVCIIIYELLMLSWSIILLNENHLKEKGKFSFALVLFTSSIPILLILRLYILQKNG